MSAHLKTPATLWKYCVSIDGDFKAIYPDTGKYEFPIAVRPQFSSKEIWDRDATYIVRCVNSHAALVDALNEAAEYFNNIADAEYDQDGLVPNKEMRLLSEINTALKLAEPGQ